MADDCYEWTLAGSPWHPKLAADGIMARHVIAVFLAVLKQKNWKLVRLDFGSFTNKRKSFV